MPIPPFIAQRAKLTARCKFSSLTLDTKARERRVIERDLRLALARDELFLVFQPFLDLAQNRLTGCEALLRWRHPIRGIIFPEEFIQIAEATELIHPIGEWVIREACRAASDWPKDTKIAINFSPVQFRKASIFPGVHKGIGRCWGQFISARN